MKPETLVALQTDRALGELPPGVEELLEAYCLLDAAAAGAGRRCGEAVDLARRALALPRETCPPLPTLERLERARRPTAGLRGHWAEITRLAACVALGVLAGWGIARRDRVAALARVPAVAIPDAARSLVPPAAAKDGTPDLWSVAYLLGAKPEAIRDGAGADRAAPGPLGSDAKVKR